MPEHASYVQQAIDAANRHMPREDPELIRLYTLLALVKGEATTLEDVHDAWSLWCMGTRPDHPSVVAFDELPGDVQGYDRPYMEAIHQVASEVP